MVAEEARRTKEYAEVIAARGSLKYLPIEGLSLSNLKAIADVQRQHNRSLLREAEVSGYLTSLSDKELLEYADRLSYRLRDETAVLDHLESEGLDPFASDLRDVKVPFPVRYVSSDELQEMHGYPKRTSACYQGGTIFIGGELPGLRERLKTFAGRGILSNDLFHEVYHGFQDGELEFESMEDLLSYLAGAHPADWRVALAESHAWMSSLRGFKDEVLIPVIQDSYRIENRDYLEAAFAVVNALYALGLTDREIGRVIRRARWDEEAGGYRSMEKEIEKLAQKHGHSLAELDEQIKKHKQIERIHVLRGMGIAAEICEAN